MKMRRLRPSLEAGDLAGDAGDSHFCLTKDLIQIDLYIDLIEESEVNLRLFLYHVSTIHRSSSKIRE